MGNTTPHDDQARGSDVLALGFGTTVAMWTVGYFGRLPEIMAPAPVLSVLLLLCLLGGGIATARLTGGGFAKGLQVGALSSVLNLLVLGSLLAADGANRLVPAAAVWLPGFLIAGTLIGGLGARLGGRPATTPCAGHDLVAPDGLTGRAWDAGFALVACGATLLLLAVGGVVTAQQAGLAVVDWPNSFGSNMFLYPLARMSGGIYFEHSHRLIGSLVGLTTLVLAIQLWRVEDRTWVKRLAALALVMVIVQGVLGGLRVTGHFTMSQDAAVTAPSITLAVVHGVLGQVFLATMVGLFCVATPLWRRASAQIHPSAGVDRSLSRVLVIMVILQLVLGAVLRHMAGGLLLHISMAVIVAGTGLFAGMRAREEHRTRPILPGLGQALMIMLALQIILGLLALWATSLTGDQTTSHLADVILTTAHQTLGALILAVAMMLMLWSGRLIRPEA